MAKVINTPVTDQDIDDINIGDMLLITGLIYTGRDAVLPKIVSMIKNNSLNQTDINLQGSIIFHTAVSPAGIGPTSSNKLEIESNIPALAKAGVKIHLGKGDLKPKTIELLNEYKSIFAKVPPVSSLLTDNVTSEKVVAFSEEGMEAFHELKVVEFPAIVAAAHGQVLSFES